jgi:hypothetical protein
MVSQKRRVTHTIAAENSKASPRSSNPMPKNACRPVSGSCTLSTKYLLLSAAGSTATACVSGVKGHSAKSSPLREQQQQQHTRHGVAWRSNDMIGGGGAVFSGTTPAGALGAHAHMNTELSDATISASKVHPNPACLSGFSSRISTSVPRASMRRRPDHSSESTRHSPERWPAANRGGTRYTFTHRLT